MPAVSSHSSGSLPLDGSSSPSSQPSLLDPRNDDDTVSVHSPGLDVSRALSSRPSSRLGLPELDVQVLTGNSPQSPLENTIGFQSSSRRLPINKAPDDSDDEHSWPFNQSGALASSPSPHQQPRICHSPPRPHSRPAHPPPPLPLPPPPKRRAPPPQPPPPPPRQSFKLAPRHSSYQPWAPSRGSSGSQHVIQSSGQYLQQSQARNTGMFNQARGFSALGTFVGGNVGTVNVKTSDKFMEKLLKRTIPGAAFNSSAPYRPPLCHPETRLAILGRCLQFIATCSGEKKMRWVVGVAGVGKSAIMQSVADSPELSASFHASVSFSINGRNDGTKAIMTLSYQLAAKCGPYRQIIEYEIMRDPSLLQASMPVQFQKLIVEPFIHHPHLNAVGCVLIIIDGLDACSDPLTQRELLCLISDFCIAYPSSPITWLVASRPEEHITSFFSGAEVIPAYEKEEILVDSEDARADVEQFLRAELMTIKIASGLPDPPWPKEKDFWKIANASGGLFAFARTVTRYIGDSRVGSPALQLSDVLDLIDEHPMTGLSLEERPMALLDALYARILSRIPAKIMIYTRKLLLALASNWNVALSPVGLRGDFVVLCNWLGLTPDQAYAAINHLYSVFLVPKREDAHMQSLEPYHKSFIDFISDFSRSSLFPDIKDAAYQLKIQCASRILKEAPDGVDFGKVGNECHDGTLTQGPGTGNNILLTWPIDEEASPRRIKTRLEMYKLAVGEVVAGLRRGDSNILNVSCIRLLATRFESYTVDRFPRDQMQDLVFDGSRRDEFMTCGILKQIPLKLVNISKIFPRVKLRVRRLATMATDSCDPWDSSCNHKWREDGKGTAWTTDFWYDKCKFCHQRFQRQLKSRGATFPNDLVPILFTSTKECCAEFRFGDSHDGMREWTYWFWFHFPRDERPKYGIYPADLADSHFLRDSFNFTAKQPPGTRKDLGEKLDSLEMRPPGAPGSTKNNKSLAPITRKERLSSLLGRQVVEISSSISHLNHVRPRCYPSTREEVLGEIRTSIQDTKEWDGLMFLRGAAGVGKTAIMQTLAERESEGKRTVATIFYERRSLGSAANPDRLIFPILAHQLALQDEAYANEMLQVLGRSPSVIRDSLQKQFQVLIVEPLARRNVEEKKIKPALIMLDGLDGCWKDKQFYREIVQVISHCSSAATLGDVLWIISSRLEPFTVSSSPRVKEIDIPIDSDDACEDMEGFLRNQFDAIGKRFPNNVPDLWPLEDDLLRVATVASGYFAFATSIIDFVGDPSVSDPVGQLNAAIAYITGYNRSISPFATLDNLYNDILGQVSPRGRDIAMRLISLFLIPSIRFASMPLPLTVACNILRVSVGAAYDSLTEVSALLDIPVHNNASMRPLKLLHGSFGEFLLDPARSGMYNIDLSAYKVEIQQCCTSIAQQVNGTLDQAGRLENIQLSWCPTDSDVGQERKKVYVFAARILASLWDPELP